MKNTPEHPFEHWSPAKANKIIDFVEKVCRDEEDAAAHLATCLMALTSLENGVKLCEFVEFMTIKAEKEGGKS